jgi:heavy metal efflux system protein
LASIEYTEGPAKISRDNTNRRITIGINVRNRDLQSVVADIRQIIDTQIKLPSGYRVTYGGQFENLQSAKDRLIIAVPIALILIFILLYFAFGSIKEALLVYTAIPLSAVGGVLLLWIRDLPFSISAGVGFIALFGIAVLNGIVLIEHFKELKHQGMKDINQIIIKGTTDRLRPVLLTAAAAALGFLPMAISSSAGAEVQRPLATVVIGGLITATLLTLIVLPILFKIFDEKEFTKPKFKINHTTYCWVFFLFSISIFAQEKNSELDSIFNKAIKNNKGLKSQYLQIDKANAYIKTAYNFEKTNIYYSYDQNNLAVNNLPLKVMGIQQSFDLPMVYKAQKRVNESLFNQEKNKLELDKNKLKNTISKSYYQIVYLQNKEKLFQYLDSLYHNFSKASDRRFELGETNYLEKITALAKYKQVETQLQQLNYEKKAQLSFLQSSIQSGDSILIKTHEIKPLIIDLENNKTLIFNYLESISNQLKEEENLIKKQRLPSLNLEYFQGTNNGISQSLYGFQIGIGLQLLNTASKAKIKTQQLKIESWEIQKQNESIKIDQYLKQKKDELQKHQSAIDYYNKFGKKLSEEILKVAQSSYKHGEIDFFQYIQSLENAIAIKIIYLDAVNLYNQTILELQYINY